MHLEDIRALSSMSACPLSELLIYLVDMVVLDSQLNLREVCVDRYAGVQPILLKAH